MFKLPESAQEVFDIVYKHLMTQMKRCENEFNCLYRGENGLKCAAGCLIPDEEYKEEMEVKLWSELVSKKMVPPDHQNLITDLQYVHDRIIIDKWKERLSATAINHGLTCPNLESL